MTNKALTAGCPCPEGPAEGITRLYSMRYCPFTHRVRLMLAQKNVPHDIINVHPKNKPEWLTSKSPYGTVPCLEVNGSCLWESAIIMDYLDDAYPEFQTYPKDAFKKARHRLMMDGAQKHVIGPYFKILRSSPEEKASAKEMFKNGLMRFEKHCQAKYFGGSEPALVDYYLYPWFERFDAIRQVMPDWDPLPADTYPKLTVWVKSMQELPAVKACQISTEHHVGFIRSVVEHGKPDVDFGLE